MVGAINFYPFDSYILNLHMKLRVSPLDKNDTSVVFPFSGPLNLIFDYRVMRNETQSLQDGLSMSFAAIVTRKPTLNLESRPPDKLARPKT
jgi:hypothetical protein